MPPYDQFIHTFIDRRCSADARFACHFMKTGELPGVQLYCHPCTAQNKPERSSKTARFDPAIFLLRGSFLNRFKWPIQRKGGCSYVSGCLVR
jgi:hypothetical protein